MRIEVIETEEEFSFERDEMLIFVRKEKNFRVHPLLPYQLQGLFVLLHLFAVTLKKTSFPLDDLSLYSLEGKCIDLIHEVTEVSLLSLENVVSLLEEIVATIDKTEKEHPSKALLKIETLTLLHLIDEIKHTSSLQAFLWTAFYLSFFEPIIKNPFFSHVREWRKTLLDKEAYGRILAFSQDEEVLLRKKKELDEREFYFFLNATEEGKALKPHLSLISSLTF